MTTQALYQHTLRSFIRAQGIGIHSGQLVELVLRPAPENSGIVFRRTDLVSTPEIKALVHNVSDTTMASTIAHQQHKVQTVEHLLSAICGLALDNLYIDVSGDEVPVMDGSAAAFFHLLKTAGFVTQKATRKFIRIKRKVHVALEGSPLRYAELTPYDGYRLEFLITFDHRAITNGQEQRYEFVYGKNSFFKEIARARTFGFMADVVQLRERGLATGGGIDNAIVLDDNRVLNIGGLRYSEEFVRHKILDALGDLYLLGHPIIGNYFGCRAGHAVNNLLLRKLLSDPENYEEVSFTNPQQLPTSYQKGPETLAY